MCGIVGYIGKKNATEVILEGLKRLEYRGYDSAGIAIMGKKLHVTKAVGKVANLEEKLGKKKYDSTLGIAHTRWATHGKPSQKNSHPHTDCTGEMSLVHNGIIENYQELREELKKKGHTFRSETDSEVIAHLIEEEMKKQSFEEAFFETLRKLKGAYAIVAMSTHDKEKILAARNSSPLVLGLGKKEYILASDVSAIVEHTDQVVYLDDGEVVMLTPEGHSIRTIGKKVKKKESITLEWSQDQAQKQGYDHFMLKEIFEQPHAVEDALRGRIVLEEGNVRLGGLVSVEKRLRAINRIIIISCGTARCAGLVGEYMIEEYAGIPVEVEYAHEFRYRKPLIDAHTAVLVISQSGETADSLAALREAKNKGALTLGVVNTVGSTIARETDAGVYNHAGPEIAVASTKAFTTQLSILVLITVLLGRQRNMSFTMGKKILQELRRIPKKIDMILEQDKLIKKVAKKYAQYDDFFYLGRKYNFAIAIEGSIKLKEISYAHAEGEATGELKHGPIAMIDKDFPSVFIAPQDSVYDKSVTGIEEVRARNGKIIAVATQGDKKMQKVANDVIFIPKTLEMLTPLLSVVPLQLFAYYVAVERVMDVDKPRNLAKSVTVE